MSVLDLEKQLAFYGAYHHNPTNVAIHMTCVPILLATGFAMATHTRTLIPLPSWLTVPNLPLNLATIATILYSGFYILLEPVAGSILAPILFSITAYAKHLTDKGSSLTGRTALAVHIVSWIAQFIGHGAFEHRAPALLDNLIGAGVLAPFFVWMEVLFKLGYRPELAARVEVMVQKEIAKFKAAKAAKANGTLKADGDAKDGKTA